MPKYYFLLGSTPALSQWELESYFPHRTLTPVTPQLMSVELKTDQEAQLAMSTLGGTIKVYRHLESVATVEALVPTIGDYLSQKTEKPHFGLAYYGFLAKEPDVYDIKEYLQGKSISSRYIESDMTGLSASILLHQKKVMEIGLIKQEDTYLIVELVGVQDIDSWTVRDRQKPFVDRKKGMLPPKLARIMLNIGMSGYEDARSTTNVYDPFCGTGTVLMEAAMLGHQVIGSDASSESILGAKDNLAWLAQTYSLEITSQIFTSDATQVSEVLTPQAVDVIVTEPFLGKQTPQAHKLPNIFKGLEKMYLGAFKDWKKILKPGATLVVVIPSVEMDSKTFTLEAFVDKLSELGYTISSGPVQYARPGAFVKRNIYKFTYLA